MAKILKKISEGSGLPTNAVVDGFSASSTNAYSCHYINEQLAELHTNLESAPVGAIMPYAGSIAPQDWLICDGRAVSRIIYDELFNIIGTRYGEGDETTTFNLPNLSGRVPVGLDGTDSDFNTLGKTGGEKTHQLTIDEIPSHNHEGLYWANVDANSHVGLNNGTNTTIELSWNQGGASDSFKTGYSGGDEAHNNLQPYITINYIIKYSSEHSVLVSPAQVVNQFSTSSTNAYSCQYMNEHSTGIDFPIGYIYISTDSTSPASLFGGSWTPIKDTFLLTAGDTYNAGDSGGSSTHNHGLSAGYTMVNASGGSLWFHERQTASWSANALRTLTMATGTSTQSWGWQLGGNTDNSSTLPPYTVVYAWQKVAEQRLMDER